MTDLLAAAIIERDLRLDKYPAMIRAQKITAADAEADAKGWAAIAFALGAPCEPQGGSWPGKQAASQRACWFGGNLFHAPWFETARALDDFSLAELEAVADLNLFRREEEVLRFAGDPVKLARRDAGAAIQELIARRRADVDWINAKFRERAAREAAAA